MQKPDPRTTEPDWSDWDAETAGFECKPGIGLSVTYHIGKGAMGTTWFPWDATVALHAWLGEKIKEVVQP